MNKHIKAVVLEHWFEIDKVLFGDVPVKEAFIEEDYKNYISTKGALLSNLFELYQKIQYDPEVPEFKTVADLVESADLNVYYAKSFTSELFKDDKIIKGLKEEAEELSKTLEIHENELLPSVIGGRFHAAILDHLLLVEPLEESCKSCLESWDAKVLVDTHKKVRDDLIEAATKITEEVQEKVKDSKAKRITKGVAATGAAVGGYVVGKKAGRAISRKKIGKKIRRSGKIGAIVGAVAAGAAAAKALKLKREKGTIRKAANVAKEKL